MAPVIVLIRHAEGPHNISNQLHIHDPPINELGLTQCAQLRAALRAMPLISDEQDIAIVASPLRRTIQTALLVLDWLVDRGVPIVLDADWQELPLHPCDTGSAISELRREYPQLDYSGLDPVFPDKTSPAAQRYHFNRAAALARGDAAVQALSRRPEKVVLVVSHGGFLREAVAARWFFNADFRIFDICPPLPSEHRLRLVERAATTPNGGMGLSHPGVVELGSGVPE